MKHFALWISQTLGPNGVLALGGILLAILGIWLTMRMTNKPMVPVLRRD